MEETEKMTALKKAYAEIILNTAKEAAARIIVSERRARSFERDLSATKDEALRIMLRIKQMIDLKMNEAETKSLIQQKRIDELEAQLHEAEDIVSNLRAELYETQAELGRLSRNQQRPLDNPNHHAGEIAQADVTQEQQNNLKNNGASVVTLPLQPQQVPKMECINSVTPRSRHDNSCYEKNHYGGDAGKTDVTSIIIRSTKPELYRNGCTQRIRACDRNLLNGHLPLSEEPDDLKCEKLVKDNKDGNRIGVVVPASGGEAAQNEEKNPVHGKETMNDSKAILRLKRKRALRQKRYKTKQEAVTTPVASETPNASRSMACTSGSTNYSLQVTNNYSNADQEPGLEGRLALTIPSKSPAVAASETESVSVAVTDKDLEIADALVLITQESGSKSVLGIPYSEEEQENPTSTPEKSNAQVSDLSDVISMQSPKDRIVKYTFQRKRRRESISNDGINNSSQKDKQRTGKRQDDALNSLTSESSRDSRRTAQVARQLISMSEKTWWK